MEKKGGRMGLIQGLGRELRARTIRDKLVGECPNGHGLTEEDIAKGVCPMGDSLFEEKHPGEDK